VHDDRKVSVRSVTGSCAIRNSTARSVDVISPFALVDPSQGTKRKRTCAQSLILSTDNLLTLNDPLSATVTSVVLVSLATTIQSWHR